MKKIKPRGEIKYIMDAKFYAPTDAYDTIFVNSKDIPCVLGNEPTLHTLAESNAVFNGIKEFKYLPKIF